jgi:aminopeptidase-like protein
MTPEEAFKLGDDVFRDIKPEEFEMVENALTSREIRHVDNVNEISYHGIKYSVPKFRQMALSAIKWKSGNC